jgi:hypothetical protein
MIYNILVSYILQNNKVTEELHLLSFTSFYYAEFCVWEQHLCSELILKYSIKHCGNYFKNHDASFSSQTPKPLCSKSSACPWEEEMVIEKSQHFS